MAGDKSKDFEWLTPLLGFIGLLAGTLFFTGNVNNSNNQTNNSSSNNLPPPPVNAKPSDCGCQHKK